MTTKDSRESKGGLLPVRFSVRDWIGIVSIAITLVGAGWRFSDSIKSEVTAMGTRMSILETKVDMLKELVQVKHESDGSLHSADRATTKH